MRNTWAVLAALVLTVGCGSDSEEAVQGAAGTAVDAATGAAATAVDAATDAAVTVIDEAVLNAKSITGTAGCGQCDFKASSTCTPTLKADDGNVYALDGIDYESPVFQSKMRGNPVTVDGEIQLVDGKLHVEVASFKLQ